MSISSIFGRSHLDKVGLIGSITATLCCLGFGPLIALLSAIGAGFLLNDAVLAPLLLVFLALGVVGLSFSYKRHRKPYSLMLHVVGSVLVFVFAFIRYFSPLVWLGIAMLLGASMYDFFAQRIGSPVTMESLCHWRWFGSLCRYQGQPK